MRDRVVLFPLAALVAALALLGGCTLGGNGAAPKVQGVVAWVDSTALDGDSRIVCVEDRRVADPEKSRVYLVVTPRTQLLEQRTDDDDPTGLSRGCYVQAWYGRVSKTSHGAAQAMASRIVIEGRGSSLASAR